MSGNGYKHPAASGLCQSGTNLQSKKFEVEYSIGYVSHYYTKKPFTRHKKADVNASKLKSPGRVGNVLNLHYSNKKEAEYYFLVDELSTFMP